MKSEPLKGKEIGCFDKEDLCSAVKWLKVRVSIELDDPEFRERVLSLIDEAFEDIVEGKMKTADEEGVKK